MTNDHVVQRGDSLWAIAKRAGLSLSQLLDLNPHLDVNDVIHPGERVRVQPDDAVYYGGPVRRELSAPTARPQRPVLTPGEVLNEREMDRMMNTPRVEAIRDEPRASGVGPERVAKPQTGWEMPTSYIAGDPGMGFSQGKAHMMPLLERAVGGVVGLLNPRRDESNNTYKRVVGGYLRGRTEKITEEDLSSGEAEALRALLAQRQDAHRIHYNDYRAQAGSAFPTAMSEGGRAGEDTMRVSIANDPYVSLAYLLGEAGVKDSLDYNVVYDTYDFNQPDSLAGSSLLNFLLGAKPETATRPYHFMRDAMSHVTRDGIPVRIVVPK